MSGAARAPRAASTRRRLGRKLALMFASIALSCLLCEGLVRIALGEQPKFPRRVVEGPHGLRVNEPGARYRHRSADVDVAFRINSKGLRSDRDFPYDKPAGVQRIVALGDSFTVGYEVEIEDCFTSVAERELAAKGRRVEVLNAGVSGFGTAEELLYLERELIRYAPDVVVVGFYGNDLVDNVRCGLFVHAPDDVALRQEQQRYVPLGTVGNFLNTNGLFNLLSERSDAFALFKESATRMLKGKMVRENLDAIDAADGSTETRAAAARARSEYATALTAALYERLLAFCRDHGVALVILSIPSNRGAPIELVDLFPRDRFDLARPGIQFLSGKELLDPFLGKELLYWTRSTGHWTPFSHEVCGKALAARIDQACLASH